MAVPTTGYASATIQNPDSALTDFTLIIDLAEIISDEADFGTAFNTDDQGRGRAYKSDGTTELACDWIDLDNSNSTGLLRVKFSGSLASTGTQTIRIYPPNTGNSQYAADDTYGSDNAYDDSWESYLPTQSDFLDRTSNGNDGTGAGSISAGDSTGKFGNATEFDGTDDDILISSNTSLQITGDLTLSAWVNLDITTAQLLFYKSWNGEFSLKIDGGRLKYTDSEMGDEWVSNASTISTSTWSMLGIRRISGVVYGFIDGSPQTSVTQAGARSASTDDITIGSEESSYFFINGLGQDFQIQSTGRSDDWISEEYDQTNDNSTFWGTWGWTAGGTPTANAPTADLQGPLWGPLAGPLMYVFIGD